MRHVLHATQYSTTPADELGGAISGSIADGTAGGVGAVWGAGGGRTGSGVAAAAAAEGGPPAMAQTASRVREYHSRRIR